MTKMKYVWAAVLVALCLSLSGAAIAADGWTVTSQDLPAAIEWDASVASSVDTSNTGDTTWDSNYALVSVMGGTLSAVPVDRWGVQNVPVTGVTVPAAGSHLFEFDVVGPPMTTLMYSVPLTPTTVAVDDPLDCNWQLANPYTPTATLVTTDIAVQATTVSRFPDDQPGTSGAWARFWIEEAAGRVPLIVAGYPDGTYRPEVEVDRAAMAVYMTRALQLATGTYQGTFTDVASDHWAWPWIEALAGAGIVAGYGDGTYRPSVVVNRDAMAVYVARGMVGGMNVPSGPATPTFTDVGTGHWAYNEIEYTVAQNVVRGYGDGTYRPDVAVTRDQMAVYVYKGFVMPTGAVVLLGGPAITAVDPSSAAYLGWSSPTAVAAADPGYAYVLLDAARLDTNLAPLTVKFELVGPASPTPTSTVTLDNAAITAAIAAVNATGNPYLGVSWDIPSGLATGDYTLVVTIGGNVVARQPGITLQ